MLYSKARAGLIQGFTRSNDPYEVPERAEVTVDTSDLPLEQCVELVLQWLVSEGYVTPA